MLKRIAVFIVVLLPLLGGPAAAQERTVFAAPVKADPGASEFRVSELVLSVESSAITVRLREAPAGVFVKDGRQFVVSFTGPEADALLSTLNTANLSTKSLQRYAMERAVAKLVAEGKVTVGSIVIGTPQ